MDYAAKPGIFTLKVWLTVIDAVSRVDGPKVLNAVILEDLDRGNVGHFLSVWPAGVYLDAVSRVYGPKVLNAGFRYKLERGNVGHL